ncbi:MAG: rod shape-determining protein RodA [Gammaproteobacteria bacterium]|nr:rod shape-determining protein RodA [Gammaproteobacteria bacterium]
MSNQDFVRQLPQSASLGASAHLVRMHLDPLLLLTLLAIIGFGLVMLYSASGGKPGGEIPSIFTSQTVRMGLALIAMLVAAQLHPRFYQRWAPVIYVGGVVLLVLVLLVGVKVKGSQRWLDVPGLPRFQPSELMKLAVPMMLAWYFADRALPPRFKELGAALGIIAIPTALIVLQPDLGTGILIAGAGLSLIVLAGIYWRWIAYAFVAAAAAAPGLWFLLQDYQRERILTLFDPESDPLGAGWNIIQSTTAIGSGGLYGKGLFGGTQSHLEFLPEAQTDFIIAVIGEELGLVGVLALLSLYLIVLARGLYIAAQARYTFQRLLVGTLTLTFFVYVFVNIAMVSGLLPVVGVPLPLVSYGGTSAITLMAGFGIIMAVRTHRAW